MRAWAAILLSLAAGCGQADSALGTAGSALDGRPDRSRDPRILDARRALEEGRLDVVGPLVARIGPGAGVEGPLLRARAAHLGGDLVGALSEIEAARLTFPGDGRVPATAAELHAIDGRLEAAQEEVRRGLVIDPECPDLLRARAVLALVRPGQARAGLAHLEAGLAADPDLPFVQRLLVQAHVLVARADLALGDPAAALDHAQKAHGLDGTDGEVRETLAEVLTAELRFDEAIALYEDLLREGRVRAEAVAQTHKRAATFAQLKGDLEGSIGHYLRCRALGMPDEALGHGLTVLRQECADRVGLARTLLQAGAYDDAEEQLDGALRYDPGSFDARNQLGILCFHRREWACAIGHWTALIDEQRGQTGGFPLEPVHINLAKALRFDDRRPEAVELLRGFLEERPQDEFALETQSLLRAIERELEGGG